ncbi:methyltransferase domain-containing protein [Streptomyces sp. CNQ085]|uniref:methyltransferase domain-containing protein n=1 Tax=Streptomyces sp. CNQ085 TaxID=2886944 RepID=UPI001F50BD88|nr:methyltransferase domain-containing protein [Streptomyces sp. CNQ085]MCI0383235.1 protein-L-isoaspartate O-methyltransferase [Streptomyces sp. CNQ085]
MTSTTGAAEAAGTADTTRRWHESHRRLLDAVSASGALTPDWRPSFEAVPRHLFLPERVWRYGADGYVPVHRAGEPDAWWELAYADEPVVTQLDEGAAGGPGEATSSSSMPSLVARMLAELEVGRGGERVLEIGTGTGWNAALLVHRLGDARVVTVEVDPALAERARHALASAGRAPRVVWGDGVSGWARGAPYDRVLATCSVLRVPGAWVAQTAPGGRIVAPLHRDVWSGGLVSLTVQDGGLARGRFTGSAWFMPLRADRLPAPAVDSATARSSTTGLDPARVTEPGFCAWAFARLPDITMTYADEDGGARRLWLTGRDGSAATAAGDGRSGDGSGLFEVWQYGPASPWDRVEAAWSAYEAEGRPEQGEFGLTVTRDGRQEVWLRDPAHVIG